MPLTRISMRKGKPAGYRAAIVEGLYQAMRETFNVPEGDRFMTLTEHEAEHFDYGPDYFDIKRSDDLILVQITVSNTRSRDQKQDLYRRIVAKLGKNPGLHPEDIFINLVEVLPENWSFGHGEAQYVR